MLNTGVGHILTSVLTRDIRRKQCHRKCQSQKRQLKTALPYICIPCNEIGHLIAGTLQSCLKLTIRNVLSSLMKYSSDERND